MASATSSADPARCIGTSGGTYEQLVGEHYRYDHAVFAASFPLMVLFAVLAVRERWRGRRGGPVTKRVAGRHRVATSVRRDVPGTGVWIGVGLLPEGHPSLRGTAPALFAASELSRTVTEKVGACVGRGELRADRHTWIVVTWCAPAGGDQGDPGRIAEVTAAALAAAGIDAEHGHVVPRVAAYDPGRLNTSYYPHSAPDGFHRFRSRIECELVQPRVGEPVSRTGPRLRAGRLAGASPGRGDDRLRCPVDHAASASAADVHAAWSGAWKALAAGRFRSLAPVHAHLAASHRCPACLTEELADAPAATLGGTERSTGRCPCCRTRWLTDEPGSWACLGQGALTVV